jgi:hypothetical protein
VPDFVSDTAAEATSGSCHDDEGMARTRSKKVKNKRIALGLSVLAGLLMSCALILVLLDAPGVTPEKKARSDGGAVAAFNKQTFPQPAARASPATSHDSHPLSTPRHTGNLFDDLNTWAMNNDDASRDAILAEMRNPDKEVRKAALEAAIQFGSRSVVPTLRDVAEETEDAGEKAAILEAIDYINLPSLTEYLAEKRARTSPNAANRRPANAR